VATLVTCCRRTDILEIWKEDLGLFVEALGVSFQAPSQLFIHSTYTAAYLRMGFEYLLFNRCRDYPGLLTAWKYFAACSRLVLHTSQARTNAA
jgi:hypothetical protein